MRYNITSHYKESFHKCIKCSCYERRVYSKPEGLKKYGWFSMEGYKRTEKTCTKCTKLASDKKKTPRFTKVDVLECKGCSVVFVTRSAILRKFCNSECGKKFFNRSRTLIHTLTCKNCKENFTSNMPHVKCCSEKCYYRLKNPLRECSTCKGSYEGSALSKYCSDPCRPNYKAPTKFNTCIECKVSILKPKRKCEDCAATSKSIREFNCESCGISCTSYMSTAKYCSRKCNPSRKVYKKARKRGIIKAKLDSETWNDISDFVENRPDGMELDHIIPLNHPDVCGLHNTWNFQWLDPVDNNRKSNQFDGTVSNLSWRDKI